jgi:hypothetical protein
VTIPSLKIDPKVFLLICPGNAGGLSRRGQKVGGSGDFEMRLRADL